MDFHKNQTGNLYIPEDRPKPQEQSKPQPQRRPPLQVQNDEQRERVSQALLALWDALDLSNRSHFVVPDKPSSETYEAWFQAYSFIGHMLLGEKDCPCREVLC